MALRSKQIGARLSSSLEAGTPADPSLTPAGYLPSDPGVAKIEPPQIAAPAPDTGPQLPSVIETTDASSGIDTAYTLAVGQSAQGTLTSADTDAYKVYVEAGKTYTASLVGTGSGNVTNTWLTLLNSQGQQFAFNDNGLQGQNSQYTFTASSTGYIYLQAKGYSAFNTGQYGLSIAEGSKGWFDDQMGAGVVDTDLKWSTPVVTYAFRTTAGDYGEPTFSKVNAAQMSAVEMALKFWSDVCGITFQRVNDIGSQYSDNATMLFGCYNEYDGSGAYAYYPGFNSFNGDVWLNLTSVSSQPSGLTPGQYSFFAILHEIGHAIGLSHPGLYNAGIGQVITYGNSAQFVQDTQQYSVMSYFDESSAGRAQYYGYADAPMLFDVLSIQNIYGTNGATRAGNTTYGYNATADSSLFDFTQNANPAFCLWDAGGTDALDCSQYSGAQTIDLNQGSFSSVLGLTRNISIAYGAVIENAIGGSGADYILGNDAANVLTGGDGSDTLVGGAGNDELAGGAGVDTLDGGAGNDIITGDQFDFLTGGEGYDIFYNSSADFRGFDFAGRGFEQMITTENGNRVTTVANTDGTIVEVTYDTANTQTYSFYANHYTSSWQLFLQQFIDDNGNKRNVGYDLANTETFYYYQNTYNAAGQLLTQQIKDDNGQQRVAGYDVANAASFASYVNTYDTQDRLILQQIADDNGNNRIVGYDVDNLYAWKYYQNTFDPTGKLIGQLIVPD